MPPKRAGPAFKPPRPVKETAATSKSTAAAKRVSGATASRPTGVTKKAAPAKRAAQVINSSDNEDDDLFADLDLDRDELMEPAAEPEVEDPLPPAPAQTDVIPQALLGRLLQEGFEDPNTKIHRGAMDLTTKYIDLFVKEAMSRAVMERKEASRKSGAVDIGDGFLQVEDLEKLTPQLVLDF